ncbi:MAG: hypothetical protein HQL50_08300 [Magnetococcales bacterium]|nr:hypothetical protein [Magnetococcales bacterium]
MSTDDRGEATDSIARFMIEELLSLSKKCLPKDVGAKTEIPYGDNGHRCVINISGNIEMIGPGCYELIELHPAILDQICQAHNTDIRIMAYTLEKMIGMLDHHQYALSATMDLLVGNNFHKLHEEQITSIGEMLAGALSDLAQKPELNFSALSHRMQPA